MNYYYHYGGSTGIGSGVNPYASFAHYSSHSNPMSKLKLDSSISTHNMSSNPPIIKLTNTGNYDIASGAGHNHHIHQHNQMQARHRSSSHHHQSTRHANVNSIGPENGLANRHLMVSKKSNTLLQ
jgi:hypothetical protein